MYQIIRVKKLTKLIILSFFSLLLLSCAEQRHISSQLNSDEPGVAHVDYQNASAAAYLGGYASKVSVEQGESIDFHISTSVNGHYDLTIWREGPERTLMTTIENLDGEQHSCKNGYATGCDWPVATTFTVPNSWPSGAYTAEIPLVGSERQILFWVREENPGSTSNILFLSALNTELAYTDFGGKSLYAFNSSDNVKSTAVSLNRPLRGDGTGQYLAWDGLFPIWAERNGYTIEYAADYDLAFDANLLTPYDVVVIGGHSEYWTWDMRQRLKTFVEGGGRLINLSGNTMWWQVRFENNGRTMVAYKNYVIDPETDPELVTDNNWDYPILDTEYSLIGVHYNMGGNFPWGDFSHENGYGGYGVQKPEHWVFEDTDLTFNAVFGRTDDPQTATIEHEVDGTTFNCDLGGQRILGPLGNSGTPENFTILAIAPAHHSNHIGFGVMGIYTNDNGGAVLSTSSIGWARGLNDPTVGQIMSNILDKFSASSPLPQEPKASSDSDLLFYDRFNCNRLDENETYKPSSLWDSIATFNYHELNTIDDLALTYDCGVAWTGLNLPLNQENSTKLFAQLKSNWGTSDIVYTRAYLNLDGLLMGNNERFELFHHTYDPRFDLRDNIGFIEIQKISGQFETRYKTDFGSTEWINVPNDEPFLIETEWHNPDDRISLWIDGVKTETAVSIPADVVLNRMDIVLRGVDSSTRGHLCIDEYAFDDERIGAMTLPHREASVAMTNVPMLTPSQMQTVTIEVTNSGNVEDQFELTAVANYPGWSFTFNEQTTQLLQPNESQVVTLMVTPSFNARSDIENTITINALSVPTEKSNTSFSFTVDVAQMHGFALSESNIITMAPNQTNFIYQTITNQANYADSYTIAAVADESDWGASVSQQTVGPIEPGDSLTVPIQIQSTSDLNDPEGTTVTFEATSLQSNNSVEVSHTVQIGIINLYLPIILR